MKICMRAVIATPMAICCSLALADDPDAVIRIVCDKNAQFFLIKQEWAEAPYDAPYPRKTAPSDTDISVRGLMWATESPKGLVTWHSKAVRRLCRLRGTTYTAILNGYKFNQNIQGMCGGGSPTLSLTLLQGSKVLAKDLVFDRSCPTSPNIIHSIRLEALKHEAFIALGGEDEISTKEVKVSLDTHITRKGLFDEE